MPGASRPRRTQRGACLGVVRGQGFLPRPTAAQTEVTDEAVRALSRVRDDVDRLTRRLTFQDRALGMLMEAPRHHTALIELITASMADKFRSIPDVGTAAYLRVLELAIDHAARYGARTRAGSAGTATPTPATTSTACATSRCR